MQKSRRQRKTQPAQTRNNNILPQTTLPIKQHEPPMVEQELNAVIPYDENLLERSRTQWQTGDWKNLSNIDHEVLTQHPDRGKLALLAAVGNAQLGEMYKARQFIQLAKQWGCSKKLISQILIAGVYNTLGRAANIAGKQDQVELFFKNAISIGTIGTNSRLSVQARIRMESNHYFFPQVQNPVNETAQNDVQQIVQPASYQFYLPLRINNSESIKLGFNSKTEQCIRTNTNSLDYETIGNSPLYLISNENGDFDRQPLNPQLRLSPDATYLLSGELGFTGENQSVVWFFQYAGGKKIASQNINTHSGKFRLRFRTLPTVECCALGLRISGIGSLSLSNTAIRLDQINDEMVAYLEDIKQAQRNDIQVSMQQIESCVRLQHYLGPNILLPDMHNWPISPDFGIRLINLVEENSYDAVIEFGSGTSTLILAKALARVARRQKRQPSPLLSFDHLEKYRNKTQKTLQQAGLTEHASVELAQLTPWQDENGIQFSYYSCEDALLALKKKIKLPVLKILVVIDGPPAATGKLARFPALPFIVNTLGNSNAYDFMLDDYIRTEEQEIVTLWKTYLTKKDICFIQTDLHNLEKKACLLEIAPKSK